MDLVYCDMALPADKSLQILLGNWIDKKMCKHFIWTLKFVGNSHQQIVKLARKELASRPCKYIIRHLSNHGNEVVLIGTIV